MSRDDAVRRIVKMLELTKRSPESEEGKTALSMAKKLMKKHGIKPEELDAAKINDVFNELCDVLEAFVAKDASSPAPVLEAIRMMKQKISNEERQKSLKLLRAALQIGSFWSHRAKDISTVIESVINKHGLRL